MKERPRVPNNIALVLNEEGGAAISTLMQMGEVDRVSEIYDIALTLLKHASLEVMNGRVLAIYDPENEGFQILNLPILEKIKANRGKITEEEVRKVLDNLATFLPEEDSNQL